PRRHQVARPRRPRPPGPPHPRRRLRRDHRRRRPRPHPVRTGPTHRRRRPPPGMIRRSTPITVLGWTVGAVGLVAWVVGARLGWQELLVLAGACLIAVALGVASTIGRLALDIDVSVDPPRIVVGGDAVGAVTVHNPRGRPSLGTRVELAVGDGVAVIDVGALAPRDRREEPFVSTTDRRSIIPVS